MRHPSHIIAIALLLAGLAASAFATPYWTPEQIAEEFARSGAAEAPRFEIPRGRTRTLDERAYFFHYRLLCDFLVSRQYTDAGNNLGGMIEGESGGDESIIETDNTQEAIRVWSQYAIWTGDTASYGPNIRLAQGYCRRFPAWREGGGYYAIHNCGWGFEAEQKYRQAYSDTSWTWYADSCALWVVGNPLDYDPYSQGLGQLNPLAEGLGIGGLYPHAVYRGREDWREFALNQARMLRQWFESNPDRLHANEVWALCGGTALWGVCASLFTAYPDSGHIWLMQYAPLLEVWQSTGQWNHSFCTWYCNAQHACYEFMDDATYWNNAVFITDSLIGLDTDGDGGIPPGRTFPVTNDHSWVSAYMGWMGMERIINRMPAVDVAAAGFVSPRSDLPHLAGDSLLVSGRIINRGRQTASVTVHGSGQNYSDSTVITLDAGEDSVVTFSQLWAPQDDESLPPLSSLRLEARMNGDQNPANDTLTTSFDVRRGVNVWGVIADPQAPSDSFHVRIEFYHEAYPDSAWTVIEQSSAPPYTNGSRRLMAGNNLIRVIPPAHLMIAEQWAELAPGPIPQEVDFMLDRTQIALIDDDEGRRFESYYLSSLDSFDYRVRLWNRRMDGLPGIVGIPKVIWFTGNDSLNTLDTSDEASLTSYLASGGRLLLSGQDITDDLGTASAFLTTVLGCSSRTTDTDARIVAGVDGDSISDGMTLYLIGTAGAQNQTSPSSVWAVPGYDEILHYASGDLGACGIAGAYGQGRFVFLSFGLEAVSGISNSTRRDEFLERCFHWFGDSLSSADERPELPMEITLEPNFPNPFNPSTHITFHAPFGAGPVTLTLYNLLGQEVRRLYAGAATGTDVVVSWDGLTAYGVPAPSGVYICRLDASGREIARTMHLLR